MSAGGSSRLAVARQHVRSVAPLRRSVDDEQHILIVIAVRTGHCVGRTADDGHWKVGQKDDSRQAQGRRLRAA